MLRTASIILLLMLIKTASSYGDGEGPHSLSGLLQNLRAAGEECLLLKPSIWTYGGMRVHFGAKDPAFFNRAGDFAKPEDFAGRVQVRAGDFTSFAPISSAGGLQMVGESDVKSASLNFVGPFKTGSIGLKEVESAIQRPLTFSRIQFYPPNPHGRTVDPSYYFYEGGGVGCHFKLTVHLDDGRMDTFGLKEEPLDVGKVHDQARPLANAP